MNSHIIANGQTATVNGATITKAENRPILLLLARTDVVISAIEYMTEPASTANLPGKVAAFTIGAGGYDFNIKSITFTGIATLTFRHKGN